jgi:hypothetical protein
MIGENDDNQNIPIPQYARENNAAIYETVARKVQEPLRKVRNLPPKTLSLHALRESRLLPENPV